MKKPLKILVVEDEETDYELLIRELEKAGFAPLAQRVDTEQTMSAALERQSWDIILSDHNMPGFSGIKALDLAQKKYPKTPFILLSGTVGEETAVESMRAGARDYIMKGSRFRLIPAIQRELQKSADQEKMEVLLREQEDRVRQLEKMEAIGRLASGIAHDFNNLLAIIGMCSESLLGDLQKNDPHRDTVKSILTAQERGAALTQQLLIFSRKKESAPKLVNLDKIVANLEKMLCRLLGADVELVTNFSPEIKCIKADPGQIEQVITNVLINARDAIATTGKIAIQTQTINLPERNEAAIPPGPYVVLSISDSGSGMDEPTKARIFEPFFTTKEVGKGTGLGLSIVYGIVQQSKGYIRVQSSLGEGTQFQFYFPQQKETPDAEATSGSALETTPGDASILLVDDEAELRKAVGKTLRDVGYTVIEAADAEQALQLLQNQENPIDLLITDVVMPKMSGRQLSEHICASYPGMKVLFISGCSEDKLRQYGFEEQPSHFLNKPFTTKVLMSEIKRILDD